MTDRITGHRPLNAAEVDLINDIKAAGMHLCNLTARVRLHIEAQRYRCMNEVNTEVHDAAELARLTAADPEHWLRVGTTDVQQGLMALARAVAQPTAF